jgi:hypothetical protein
VLFELAMPLKSDSTAMRAPMTEAMVNATSATAAIKKRLMKENRVGESDMAHLGCVA